MAIHSMKLFEEPFNAIKEGKKDIEVRLFDDKRREIKVGDQILFKKLPNLDEEVTRNVAGLSIFSSFHDLFSSFPTNRFGHAGLTLEEQLSLISTIYSKEAEETHGVLGIHLRN